MSERARAYIAGMRPFYEGNPAYAHVRTPEPAPRTEDDAHKHPRRGDVWVRGTDQPDVYVLDTRATGDGLVGSWWALSTRLGSGRCVAFKPAADDRYIGTIEFGGR